MRNLFVFCFFAILCSCSTMFSGHTGLMEKYILENFEGGLSGLYLEKSEGDILTFWTHSDRGPNGKKIKDPKTGVIKRLFLNPDFVPYWLMFTINRKTGEVKIREQVKLTLLDGTPLNGLPNKEGDEVAIGLNGEELKKDINGIDPESMCFDGTYFWMGEEYGPSLLKFNRRGQLLRRYVPEGSYLDAEGALFKRTLPKTILTRKLNRGFEGLSCKDGKLYAILQSPLPEDGTDIRIFEFDPDKEKVDRNFLYPLESSEVDKIGDMAVMGDSLLILEQNGEIGKKGVHKVYKVQLTDGGFITKAPVLDLVSEGYDFAEKVEGLSFIGGNEIAVVNDNDFGVNDSNLKSVLAIFKLANEDKHGGN